jgi:hypothetical protein
VWELSLVAWNLALGQLVWYPVALECESHVREVVNDVDLICCLKRRSDQFSQSSKLDQDGIYENCIRTELE